MMRLRAAAVRWTVAWACVCVPTLPARAQGVEREDFEGPRTSWRDARTNPGYRVEKQERSTDGPHSGSGCEFVQFLAGNGGTYVNLTHDVAPARVIAELVPQVWVRSDRPGIQLLAHVVFPRSVDPGTGQPASATVAGTSYERVGSWEQLRISDVPRLVAAQARVLRAQVGRDVDTREAFVDRLVLNIYSGPGRTRLWIDDLEVAGAVGEVVPPGVGPLASLAASSTPQASTPDGASESPPRDGPQLNGSTLLAGGRPFFPRAIDYQGEPLALLKELGFNTVRLRSQPTPELLAEAQRLGLWIVCPPPLPVGLEGTRSEPIALPDFGAEYDGVLAWDLGEGLTSRELDVIRRWAEQVRRADRFSRPLICGASTDLRAYSSRVDVLLLDRFTPATSFELSDYRKWLLERPRLARPGTPVWTTIPTEPAPTLVGQLAALTAGRPPSIGIGSEHARLLAYTALAAGARGLIFASHAPLSSEDPDTRWRAQSLALLNLELDLAEPWAASGNLLSTVTSSDPEIVAAVLQAGGAHLLVPIWSGRGAQYVPGQPATTAELSFIVPGVPETASAYELKAGGLRALRPKRVTGGISVTVDDFGVTSMIVLAQDLLGEVTRRATASSQRAAQLQLDLAKTKLRVATEVQGRLATDKRLAPRAGELLAAAQSEVQAAETDLAARKHADSVRHAQFSMRNVRALERAQWQPVATSLGSPIVSPFAVSYVTLPQHASMQAFIDSSRRSENQLRAGDFEDLGRMINAGWKHFQHPAEGVRIEAELSRSQHCEGQASLRLAAYALDEKTAPGQIETPPVWITSPEVPITPSRIVRLHGRVLMPRPVQGSSEGLLIIDSLGGEALAERVTSAPEWREFTMYRVADGSRPLSITFALTGLGEAWIDDVTVEPVVAGGTSAESASLDRGAVRR